MSTKLLERIRHSRRRQDLQFPHHENGNRQSEAVLDRNDRQPFVKYWIAQRLCPAADEKMSNRPATSPHRELLKRHDPEVVRFFVARAHYRSPLNYSEQHLGDARTRWRGSTPP